MIVSGYEQVMFGPVGSSSTSVDSLVEGKARAAARAAGRAGVLKASSLYENVAHRASLATPDAAGAGAGAGAGSGTDIYDFSTTTAGSHAGGASDTVGYEQAVSTQPAFYDSLNDQAEAAAAAGAGGNTSVA